jgi:hypothetical protein
VCGCAQVIAWTGNEQLDSAELLVRFHAAARLGGGWVTYQWRNDRTAPLRMRGAYITRIDGAHKHGSEGGGADGRAASQVAYPVDAADGLLAGVGYFGELSSPPVSGDWRSEAAAAVEAEAVSPLSPVAACSPLVPEMCADGEPPVPPPVPPSAAAAKAATRTLQRILSDELGQKALSAHALEAAVSDASGALAAAAAEVTCWEQTELPPALAGLLREHALGHIRAFDAGS